MEQHVVLVDTEDRPTGSIEKMKAHQRGLLHRAVSVLIFNNRNEWLLQKRTAFKYHSAGLWSNACCTHPTPGEQPAEAAQRRLAEEMGLHCPLSPLFHFTYHACLGRGMTEYEYDHVFIGKTNELPYINPAEVSDWCYLPADLLHHDTRYHPGKYTVWFHHIIQELTHRKYNL